MSTYRQELNSYYVQVFIPNIVWSMLCLVIGIVGNSCVLVIYLFKMNKCGEQRYFIPFLAFFDLCATLFAVIYFMLDYVHYVNFESEVLCKIVVFATYTWTAISAHSLLVIAVQRYLKICKPFGNQMSLFWRRVAVVITIGYSIVFSSPLLYSSGIREFDWTFKDHNVTIKTCALNARNDQQFDDIYFSLSVFLIIANILAIIGVYIPIGHVIFKSFKLKRRKSKCEDTPSNDVTAETNLGSDNDNKTNTTESESDTCYLSGKMQDVNKEEREDKTPKQNDTDHEIVKLNASGIRTTKIQHPNEDKIKTEKDRKGKVKVNFNLMFFTVIVFYLLSYIPVIVIFVMKTNEVAYWHSLTDDQMRAQLCLVRFYVINNIVNPFIYGYFDFAFRNSVKALFKCC